MKQDSADLRERLLRAIDAGLPLAEAARLFGVHPRTIRRWQQRPRTAGSVAARPRPGRTPRIGPGQATVLAAQVAAQPDATLAQHCARWDAGHGVPLSITTMARGIRRLGITVKERPARPGTGCGYAGRLVGRDSPGRSNPVRLRR